MIILSRFLGKFKNLIKTVGLTSFTVFSGDIKKKKSSENDQLTGHFRAFLFYFFRPPDPKSEKQFP